MHCLVGDALILGPQQRISAAVAESIRLLTLKAKSIMGITLGYEEMPSPRLTLLQEVAHDPKLPILKRD